MNLNVSAIVSERETIVGEAIDLFRNFSSKLPDPVVVLSDGKISMDKRVKILCPFIGDLLSSVLDEHSIVIIPDFHSRTFDCISSILTVGYGEYYSHDVKEVVELGRALNIGGINSVLVSKVGDGIDSEGGSILTDNETKKNEIVDVARVKMNMPECKASEMKKDLRKLPVENLIDGNIDTGVKEYYEDIKVEQKVKIESKASIGDTNRPLVSKLADGEAVDDDLEEGEIEPDEEETKEKEIVSRIEIAEFSKMFRNVPNILNKNEKSFKCKYCKKSFFSENALKCHFGAKHSSHASNITTNYQESSFIPPMARVSKSQMAPNHTCVICNKKDFAGSSTIIKYHYCNHFMADILDLHKNEIMGNICMVDRCNMTIIDKGEKKRKLARHIGTEHNKIYKIMKLRGLKIDFIKHYEEKQKPKDINFAERNLNIDTVGHQSSDLNPVQERKPTVPPMTGIEKKAPKSGEKM